jgi:hypothetical protein
MSEGEVVGYNPLVSLPDRKGAMGDSFLPRFNGDDDSE